MSISSVNSQGPDCTGRVLLALHNYNPWKTTFAGNIFLVWAKFYTNRMINGTRDSNSNMSDFNST